MIKRRFIAGAVCPRCAQMDKVVMYDDDMGQRVRECVSCGYRDALDENGQPSELKTRVNQPRPGEPVLAHEDEVTIVRLLDPNPGTKRRDH
ncbi:MAG TPA: YheV family putative zinc ribbon protein [Spongiibacteraceae bacterium]|nr:YheV family putative zinc ribbon protein [Spongiibacteraceae bacterium]